MSSPYEVSVGAQNDLFAIWQRMGVDTVELANRMAEEFPRLFASLAERPRRGHVRKELTTSAVLFFLFLLDSFLVTNRHLMRMHDARDFYGDLGMGARPRRREAAMARRGRLVPDPLSLWFCELLYFGNAFLLDAGVRFRGRWARRAAGRGRDPAWRWPMKALCLL